MGRIVIETKDLEKTYDETKIPVRALRGVDLEIKEGEFTAIVGPSGSGKSTLLNMIGGLDEPTSGQVWVDGIEITRLSNAKRIAFRREHIGFVFQYFNLVPVLSARENVELVMLLQGKSRKERRKRSDELLTAVGLADRKKSRPGELSGGQQQRVAVARALASKPAFILADEPTANLDSVSTNKLLDMMARLNEEEQMTFVFSTHDDRVIRRARRVVTLDDGLIVSDTYA
jgi:putative ABC transport system ATP-binding protein